MVLDPMTFDLPELLNATTPPERRGLRRDFVRMLVLDRKTGQTTHTQFYKLDEYLREGDLLVLITSRTVPAAFKLHFSNHGAALYEKIYSLGEPIRYEYIHHPWALDYYQTVYATVPGSVEMPSAGRAFSWELIFKLQRKGIRIAHIQLHTCLSYLLDDSFHQDPRDNFEQFAVPEETVKAIEDTKRSGGRIIAVGTTVVRALETSVNKEGRPTAQSGWTNLYIHANSVLQVVDALITGFHEPRASHLDLLSALIDPNQLYTAYQEAIQAQYLWHEFGDMNLIL
jgi:S-adenosylmethionine:tRNA ribosyltransferase-isomerase